MLRLHRLARPVAGIKYEATVAGMCAACRTGTCQASSGSARPGCSKPSRSAAIPSIGRDYAAAIALVALIGSFSTLHNALRLASRGRQ
jgi:hypothetical protein